MRDVEQSIEKKDKTDGKFGLQLIVSSSNKVSNMNSIALKNAGLAHSCRIE